MAGAVFTVIGAAAGPVGAIVGGVLGSLVDNFVLFPPPTPKGPRLDKLQAQGSAEGEPMPWAHGPAARSPAILTYVSELQVVPETTGGTSTSPTFTPAQYYVDADWAICEGPIEQISKLFLDGKLKYSEADPVSITTDDLSIRLFVPSDGGHPNTDVFMVVESAGNVDFFDAGFVVGQDITTSGFSNSVNNVTRICTNVVSADGSTPSGITLYWGTYNYDGSPSSIPADIPVAESAGASATISETLPYFSPKTASSFTTYTGTATQSPDPTIEGQPDVGEDEYPAMVGVAHIVADQLWLNDYGARIPQASIQVKAHSSPYTVASTVGAVMERAKITSSEYDTSNVTGNLGGTYTAGVTKPIDQLGALFLAYDLYAQESGGVLSVYDYDALPTVTVAAADLAAHEPGRDVARVVKYSTVDPLAIPSQVNVTYSDSTGGLQDGSQNDRFRSALSRVSDRTLETRLPLVLTPSEAKTIARRLRLTYLGNRIRCDLTLPPSYIKILENDKLSFTADGEDWLIRVERVERGANGLIEVSGVREEPHTHEVSVTAEDSTYTEPTIEFPSPVYLMLADIAPFREQDATVPGFYAGVAHLSQQTVFAGVAMFEARVGTDANDYEQIGEFPGESQIGYCTTALPAGVTNVWDTTSTVTVTMWEGVPASTTQAKVLTGKNLYVIGGEVVGVVTWTANGGNSYTASTLLRGGRNTESKVGEHIIGETVGLVSGAGPSFFPLELSDHGETYGYRGVPTGGNVGDAAPKTHEHALGTIRPFSPYALAATRNGSNDVAITWRPRTRSLVGLWTDVDVPTHEGFEQYEIDVLDGSTVVRTTTVISTRTWTYTAANQTADGLTPGDPVDVVIYQISTRGIGRGNGAEGTV